MPGPKRPPAILQVNGFALYGSHIVWVASIDGVNANVKWCKAVGKSAATGKVVTYGNPIPVFTSELTALYTKFNL